MASTRCYVTSARGHGAIVYCLNSGSADTQTGSHNGKGEPLTIGEACLKRILSPRPESREWDNRKQGGRERLLWPANKKGRGCVMDPPLVFKGGFLGDEGGEPCPGSRELEKRALDGENLRRALKKGGPRLEWKGRRDDKRRWRWRIRVI
ncbi:uncharacterized protein TNCV_2033121 [Trichonephila clavipes]|nr:uncharacterized protein TNCV_2033121 [Trichonephila clavipes]